MRSDIDPDSIVPLHLIGRFNWTHKNGTPIEDGDYNGYRAHTPSKERRFFLALHPGDSSVDWLDITDDIGNFMVFERGDVASRLARKLGLSQSPGKDVMQRFARSTRGFQSKGDTVDKAAMKGATEIFPAEFKPTGYAGQAGSMEALLADIEKL
jgi:hypothetical protein